MKIHDALKLLTQVSERFSQTASLDAQVVLAHGLDKPRAWVIAHPNTELSAEQISSLQRITDRLGAGEPLPYILGAWEFFGLEFTITPDVLIPRPETELLVEHALGWLKAQPGHRRVADVGTGSGCIMISLATQFPDLLGFACDISGPALKVAKQNIKNHNLEGRIHLVCTNLLAGINPPHNQKFDLICANLPYIPRGTLKTLAVSRREPGIALNGGDDGLDLIRRLILDVPAKIAPGGLLLLEIEFSQGRAVESLVRSSFPSASVSVLSDLAGHDRLVVCQD